MDSEKTPKWATTEWAQNFKDALTRVGIFFPRILIQCMDSTLHYLEAGRWMRAHGFTKFARVSRRDEIFQWVAERHGESKLLYLEFGVHQGATIKAFAKILKSSSAILHGFDSFVGLPERWNSYNKRGHFSTDGQIPQISDRRVSFFKGWFHETLKSYTLPEHDLLFINIDCDLYSSSSQVLSSLMPHIRLGTLLYFDEFYDRNHELKAFEEFLEVSGYKFECLLSTKALASVLFRRIS